MRNFLDSGNDSEGAVREATKVALSRSGELHDAIRRRSIRHKRPKSNCAAHRRSNPEWFSGYTLGVRRVCETLGRNPAALNFIRDLGNGDESQLAAFAVFRASPEGIPQF
jgi:hypothetical protein